MSAQTTHARPKSLQFFGRWLEIVRDNPVLAKEMRVRMRGARAYWILAAYLLTLSITLFVQYLGWYIDAIRHGTSAGSAQVGQQFFVSIWIVQAFLVAFITPAITAGAITIEKEQQTLDLLMMTRLRPSAVVAGKLLSAVGFVALLLVSSIPLTCLCFFLGGVSPEQVLHSYMVLLAAAFFTGSLGLSWSSIARSTTLSVIYTYGSLLGVAAILLVVAIIGSRGSDDQIASGLALAVYGLPSTGDSGYMSLLSFFHAWDSRHYYGLTLPTWFAPVLTYTLLGLLLSAATAARLRPLGGRKPWLVGALLVTSVAQQLFFAFGGWFFAFTPNAPPGIAQELSAYSPLMLLFQPVALLLLCLPVLSTIDASRCENRPASKGVAILLGMLLLTVAVYSLSFAIVGQPEALLSGRLNTPLQTNSPYYQYSTLYPTVGSVWTVAVAAAASLIGLASVGRLLRAAVRNRWAALVLHYAILLVILIVPMVAKSAFLSAHYSDKQDGASFLLDLIYLDPFASILEATNASSHYRTLPILFGPTPIWQVTVAAWLALALVCVFLAARIEAQRSQPAPLAVSC